MNEEVLFNGPAESKLQINDILCTLPPASLKIFFQNRIQRTELIRSASEIQSRSGQSAIIIQTTLVFTKEHYNTELIPLLIQFRKTPFCYLNNEAIRKAVGPKLLETAVAGMQSSAEHASPTIVGMLLSISGTTDPDSPGTIIVTIAWQVFNYFPFLNKWEYKRHFPSYQTAKDILSNNLKVIDLNIDEMFYQVKDEIPYVRDPRESEAWKAYYQYDTYTGKNPWSINENETIGIDAWGPRNSIGTLDDDLKIVYRHYIALDQLVSTVKENSSNTDPTKSINPLFNTKQKITIKEVHDGDTVILEDKTSIRLLNIDTAEISGKDVNFPFADRAKRFLEDRLGISSVQLQEDIEVEITGKDVHGRYLGFLFKGETLLNAEMVREGLSPYVTSFGIHTEYHSRFLAAEQQAIKEGHRFESQVRREEKYFDYTRGYPVYPEPVVFTLPPAGYHSYLSEMGATEEATLTNKEYLKNIYFRDYTFDIDKENLVVRNVSFAFENKVAQLPMRSQSLATAQHMGTSAVRFSVSLTSPGVQVQDSVGNIAYEFNPRLQQLLSILRQSEDQVKTFKNLPKKDFLFFQNQVLQLINIGRNSVKKTRYTFHGTIDEANVELFFPFFTPVNIESFDIESDPESPNSFILNIRGIVSYISESREAFEPHADITQRLVDSDRLRIIFQGLGGSNLYEKFTRALSLDKNSTVYKIVYDIVRDLIIREVFIAEGGKGKNDKKQVAGNKGEYASFGILQSTSSDLSSRVQDVRSLTLSAAYELARQYWDRYFKKDFDRATIEELFIGFDYLYVRGPRLSVKNILRSSFSKQSSIDKANSVYEKSNYVIQKNIEEGRSGIKNRFNYASRIVGTENAKSFIKLLQENKATFRDNYDFVGILDGEREISKSTLGVEPYDATDVIKKHLGESGVSLPNPGVIKKLTEGQECCPDLMLPPNPFYKVKYGNLSEEEYKKFTKPYFFLRNEFSPEASRITERLFKGLDQVVSVHGEAATKYNLGADLPENIIGNKKVKKDRQHASTIFATNHRADNEKLSTIPTKEETKLQLYTNETIVSSMKKFKDKIQSKGLGVLSPEKLAPSFKVFFRERTSDNEFFNSFDEFYGIHSVRSIVYSESRKFPAGIIIIEVNNSEGSLTNRRYPFTDAALTSSGNLVDSAFLNPNRDKTEKLNSFVLKDGTEIQVKIGYSNNPSDLETILNGSVFSVEGSDVLTIKCYSFGYELAAKEYGNNYQEDSTPTSDDTADLIEWCLNRPEVTHFGRTSFIQNLAANKDETFGIFSSLNQIQVAARRPDGTIQSVWSPINNPVDDNIWVEPILNRNAITGMLYSTGKKSAEIGPKNIKLKKAKGSIVDRFFDFLTINPEDTRITAAIKNSSNWLIDFLLPEDIEKYKHLGTYVINKQTLWDVIQEMTLRHMRSIAAIRVFQNRTTLFFGNPSLDYFYRDYSAIEKLQINKEVNERKKEQIVLEKARISKFKEEGDDLSFVETPIELNPSSILKDHSYLIMEPFRRYHYIDSDHSILENNIKADYTGTFNEISIQYADTDMESSDKQDTKAAIEDQEQLVSITRKLNQNINDNHIRSTSFGFPNVRTEDVAERYAASLLMQSAWELYKGSITIIGNERIRPWDIVYVYDEYSDMYGPIQVREVTHTMSVETGFITEIVPDMIATINDYVTEGHLTVLSNVFGELFKELKESKWKSVIVSSSSLLVDELTAVGAVGVAGQGAKVIGNVLTSETISKIIPTRVSNFFNTGKAIDFVKNIKINPTSPGLQKLTQNIISKSIGNAARSLATVTIAHPFLTIGIGLALSVGVNALYKYFDDSNLNLIILTPMMKGGLPYVYGIKGYELGSFAMHLNGQYTKSLTTIKENFNIIKQVYDARGLTTTALATLALLFED